MSGASDRRSSRSNDREFGSHPLVGGKIGKGYPCTNDKLTAVKMNPGHIRNSRDVDKCARS